jgi:hypothetical protein
VGLIPEYIDCEIKQKYGPKSGSTQTLEMKAATVREKEKRTLWKTSSDTTFIIERVEI